MAKHLDGWISREDLAHELGISVGTLARWAADGFGPPFARVGRRSLYHRDDVDRWLRDQQQRTWGQRDAGQA